MSRLLSKTPPHSIEAEMSVLGAMLIDNNCIPKVSEMLDHLDFYKTAHQEIFKAIGNLNKLRTMVDPLTLREELKKRSLLENVGGDAYLVELEECVPHAENIEYYSKIVFEKSVKRKQIECLLKGLRMGFDDFVSPEEVNKAISSFTVSRYIGGGKTVKLKLTTIKDVLNFPEPEYLIENLIERNTLNILSAESGIGKTLLAFAITKSLVTGVDFLGHFKVRKKCKVLIVDQENSKPHLRDRIEKMGFKEDMPVFFLHFQGVKLDNSAEFSDLLAVIQSLQPDFIIFDALIRLHDRDENSNSEMAKVMGCLRDIVGTTDATVLLIHHDRKNTDGNAKQKARGASDIIGAVDCHLSLAKQKDNTLILSPGKTRSSSFESMVLKFNEDTFEFELIGVGDDGIKARKDSEIIKAIVQMLDGKELSLDEIAENLKKEIPKIGSNRLRDILNDNFNKKPSGHNKAVYFNKTSSSCIKSSLPGGDNKGREAETLENKGVEASFTVSQGVCSTGNRETGNADIESKLFKNLEVYI